MDPSLCTGTELRTLPYLPQLPRIQRCHHAHLTDEKTEAPTQHRDRGQSQAGLQPAFSPGQTQTPPTADPTPSAYEQQSLPGLSLSLGSQTCASQTPHSAPTPQGRQSPAGKRQGQVSRRSWPVSNLLGRCSRRPRGGDCPLLSLPHLLPGSWLQALDAFSVCPVPPRSDATRAPLGPTRLGS